MSVDVIAPTVREHVALSESERLARIARAWRFYLGSMGDAIPPTAEGIDDNVRINLSAALVDKGVSWLFGADRGLGFSILGDDEKADEKAERELEDLWPTELRALRLHQLGVNGGVAGHAWARLMPDGRVIVLDPSNMEARWEAEDYEDVYEYVNTFTIQGADDAAPVSARRQRFLRSDAGTSWEVIDEKSDESGGAWVEVDRFTHGFEWAPVFQCQNLPMPNEFYGRSDLEADVLDLVEAINAVASYMRKLTRQKGHQLPYVTGEQADAIKQLDAQLGRLLAIPNELAKVGQLEAASLGGVGDLYDRLWSAFHYVTRTPPIAFGYVGMSNVAEDTVELAFAPAVEKTWDKRLTYGPMLIDLSRRMLEQAGTADRRPKPTWTSVVPRSAGAEAKALETDVRMGIVSKETASEKRGYDWQTERTRMDEEAAEGVERAAKAFNGGGGGGAGGGFVPPANDPNEDPAA